VTNWPGQVVLAVSKIYWTYEVQDALDRLGCDGLKEYAKKLDTDLISIVELVRGNLSKNTRITLGSLLTHDVHAKDIVNHMIKEGVEKSSDFQWLAQLRFYWENEQARGHIINTEVQYAYEYVGNSSRLVMTPLTDRCYRTLAGALSLNLGGAPQGPAGTGKTETVKVSVIDCSYSSVC
jgi:dynein heavy chain